MHNSLLRRVFSTSEDRLVTGNANAECSVIPWMLCAALPVGAVSSILIASGFVLGNGLNT